MITHRIQIFSACFITFFAFSIFTNALSAEPTIPAATFQRELTWKGGGNVRFADLAHWSRTAVTEKFGSPADVFSLDKVGQSKVPHWARPIPKGADLWWRYRPKDNTSPLVERIIFLRKGTPLLVVQTESDW